jgi:hypothetical protein
MTGRLVFVPKYMHKYNQILTYAAFFKKFKQKINFMAEENKYREFRVFCFSLMANLELQTATFI